MGARACARRVSRQALDWLPAAALARADALASKAAFDADRRTRAELFAARDLEAMAALRDAGVVGLSGRCPLCVATTRFVIAPHGGTPNLREGMACPRCRTPARVRAVLVLLQALCPNADARIYLTEQASAAFLWTRRHYPRAIGSEFAAGFRQRLRLSRYLWRARRLTWVRYEDVTRLRLATASQDAVVCQEVIEHVADDRAALREFARITRPGGWLVLTAPFAGGEHGIARTRISPAGDIEHLLPPEVHGDPLGGGVLCHRHYGWDLLDALRLAGFRDAALWMPWWPQAGLFEGLATFVARR